MRERQKEIHDKGFGMGSSLEFGKMKVGKKSLQDAALDLGALKQVNKNYGNKAVVLKALANKDIATLREISNYFYRTSGIYLEFVITLLKCIVMTGTLLMKYMMIK